MSARVYMLLESRDGENLYANGWRRFWLSPRKGGRWFFYAGTDMHPGTTGGLVGHGTCDTREDAIAAAQAALESAR